MGTPEKGSSSRAELKLFLKNKKNLFNFHSTSYYHELLFCCDKFRDVFKLPDFGARDLDTALELESQNHRAGLKSVYRAGLIRKLFISLAKPFARVAFNESNYNQVLHGIFERRLIKDSDKMLNPMGDVNTADVHCLPTEVKLYLLHFLLNLRIDKNESEAVDNFCEADALRVLELGSDSSGNSYFYFGDFRIVVELKDPQTYTHAIDPKLRVGSPWASFYEMFTEKAQFLCLAETREQWKSLWEVLEKSGMGKSEKGIGGKIKNLFNSEHDIFVSELNRRAQIRGEEERLLARAEFEAKKALGYVRTSGRIQAKEMERRLREEEERKRLEEEERENRVRLLADGNVSVSRMSLAEQKKLTREERRLQREAYLAEQDLLQSGRSSVNSSRQPSINGTDISESGDNSNSPMDENSSSCGHRSASGSRREMYSDATSLVSSDLKRKNDESLSVAEPAFKQKREHDVFQNGTYPGQQAVAIEPFCCGSLTDCSLSDFYETISGSLETRMSAAYQQSLIVAERFLLKELGNFDLTDKESNTDWKPVVQEIFSVLRPSCRVVNSRLNIVAALDNMVGTIKTPSGRQAILPFVKLVIRCWDLLFTPQTQEDSNAKIIMDKLSNILIS